MKTSSEDQVLGSDDLEDKKMLRPLFPFQEAFVTKRLLLRIRMSPKVV